MIRIVLNNLKQAESKLITKLIKFTEILKKFCQSLGKWCPEIAHDMFCEQVDKVQILGGVQRKCTKIAAMTVLSFKFTFKK